MTPKRKKVKQVLYLFEEQVKALKKRADALDIPMSQLLRQAIDEYLKNKT